MVSGERTLFRNLKAELEVIASDELADVLADWGEWSAEQLARLQRYLREEMEYGGMLSVEKAREAGQSLGRERAEARRVLARAVSD